MYLLQHFEVVVVAAIDHANGSLMYSTQTAGAAAENRVSTRLVLPAVCVTNNIKT